MTQKDFAEQAAQIVRRACEVREEAQNEGLLGVEKNLDALKIKSRDIFEYGMRFVIDGTDPEIIRGILSSLISQEPDAQKRRLKEMQKDAVLGIQAGDNRRVLLLTLMSRINDPALENALMKTSHDESTEVPEQEKKSIARQTALTVKWAVELTLKAGREGLLSLEELLDDIDIVFLKHGLRMVVDGTDRSDIERILSNRISCEQDEDARRLNEMQKDTVLDIREENYYRIVNYYRVVFESLMARIGNSKLKAALRKAFEDFETSGIFNFDMPDADDAAPEAPEKEKKGFMELAALTIQQAAALLEKARREGLLALEADLEGIDDEYLTQGLRLLIDGIAHDLLDRILSAGIAIELDENTRRLKSMQKDVVLGIHAKDKPIKFVLPVVLFYTLLSHLDDSEQETLRRTFPDMFSITGYPFRSPQPRDESEKGFIQQLGRILHDVHMLSEKARRQGLMSLEESLQDMEDGFFKTGIHLLVCGTDSAAIDRILSAGIAIERDNNARRLKTIQKEAVLGIVYASGTLWHIILSHIDNSELNALRKIIPVPFFFFSDKFPCGCDAEPENEEGKGFVLEAARIVRRAVRFNGKARKEGLLNLEGDIDGNKVKLRDIFEYGIGLVVHGIDTELVRKILFNLIACEQDGSQDRRLKEIQMEAVLCIAEGLHPIVFSHILLSRTDNSELEALLQSAGDISRAFHYEGIEQAEAKGAQSRTAAGKNTFRVFRDLKERLEESFGSRKAVKIVSRLESNLLEEDEGESAEEIERGIFMFDDIAAMPNDRDIQKVLKELYRDELAKALGGADADVQNKIFRNISRRAAAMLKDDIEYMGPIRLTDAEEARRKVVSIIRHLSSNGTIDIGRRRDPLDRYEGWNVSQEFFKILKELRGLLEISHDRKAAMNIINGLASRLRIKLFDTLVLENNDHQKAIPEAVIPRKFFRCLAELLGRDKAIETIKRLASRLHEKGLSCLANEAEKSMISIEDIAALDDQTFQNLLAEIDFMNLVRALKGVEMSVRVTIVEKMDAETASAFKEAFLDIGPQRAIDIIHAQKEIISTFFDIGKRT